MECLIPTALSKSPVPAPFRVNKGQTHVKQVSRRHSTLITGCRALAGISTAKTMKNIAFILRIIGYVFLIAGIILVILYTIQYIDALNKSINTALSTGELKSLGTVLYNILYAPITMFALSTILNYISSNLEKRAEEAKREFLEKLSGLLLIYRGISIQELARRVHESPKAVEEALAEIVRNGKLQIHVDSNGIVHIESATPKHFSASPGIASVTSPIPPPPQLPQSDRVRGEAMGEGTQVLPQSHTATPSPESQGLSRDVEEKLKRIEEAYRKGLISEETYRKLLEKLRKGQA